MPNTEQQINNLKAEWFTPAEVEQIFKLTENKLQRMRKVRDEKSSEDLIEMDPDFSRTGHRSILYSRVNVEIYLDACSKTEDEEE